MYLPEIKNYISNLSRVEYRHVGNDFTYTNESYQLLDRLFSIVAAIAPDQNGIRRFWVKADRGSIEDAQWDYEEMLDDGEVQNREEFVAMWLDCFPNETDWIELAFVIEDGYRAVFAAHKMVLECDSRKPHKSYPYDVSEFVEWLIKVSEETVEALLAGTYNSMINETLPPQHRVGTIRRRDFYKVFPNANKEDFVGLSCLEMYEFIGAASHNEPCGTLTSMCANDFYKFCSLGYVANGYHVTDMTPMEQYKRFADGRDEGLSEIDPNSHKAFSEWLKNRQGGGHPFEVCRGGNSTHIDLFVTNKQGKYLLTLRGDSENRFVETIKFYLALRHAKVPVVLLNAKKLVDRVLGEEEIGIVPEGVFPRYCASYFPGKEIISFMNLPEENREELVSLCKWHDIAPVSLCE